MAMKVSLALGSREPLSRQTAWGCFTGNLALPGSGSLIAGRRSGYVQLALAAISLVLTLFFGVRAILWFLANWSRLNAPSADPFESLKEMWHVLKWAVLGIGLFLVAWLWALATSLWILRGARAGERSNAPPPFYK